MKATFLLPWSWRNTCPTHRAKWLNLLAAVALVATCEPLVLAATPRPPKHRPVAGKKRPAGRTISAAPALPVPHTAVEQEIVSVLGDKALRHAHVGVLAIKASSGEVVFSHNPDTLFNPASNTKLVTTATILELLGPHYQFMTAALGGSPDENGIIHGDVVLRGSGDPSLKTKHLYGLADELARRGVVTVTGDVVVDTRLLRSERCQTGCEVPDQLPALAVEQSSFRIRVSPGTVGHSAAVHVDPFGDLFTVHNLTRTVAGKRARLQADFSPTATGWALSVRGRIGVKHGDVVVKRLPPRQDLFAGWIFKNALGMVGVEVKGVVRRAPSAEQRVLALHRSAPLAEICRLSNKWSNNQVADALFRALAVERDMPATYPQGSKAVQEFLSGIGLAPNTFRFVNGSGLTRENRMTPRMTVELLRYLIERSPLAADFMESLSVSGVDGTLRHRFVGTTAVGLVRGKTGTLSSVSALSGYVGEAGRMTLFSIFMEGFAARRVLAARQSQARIVYALLRALRKEAGIVVPDESIPAELPDGPSDLDELDQLLLDDAPEEESAEPAPGAAQP